MPDAELRLPADARYVGLARMVVCAAARQVGMDDERVEDLRIAVSEATANAVAELQVQPGGGETVGGRPDQVVLQFGPGPDGFAVTVRDTGSWPEPPSAEPAAGATDAGAAGAGIEDDSTEQDLAVTLIRGLADNVQILPGEDGRVHMRFSLALLPDAGSETASGPAEASA